MTQLYEPTLIQLQASFLASGEPRLPRVIICAGETLVTLTRDQQFEHQQWTSSHEM